MPWRGRIRLLPRRTPVVLVAFAVLVTGFSGLSSSPVLAQEPQPRWSLRNWFAPPRRLEPRKEVPTVRERRPKRQSARTPKRDRQSAPRKSVARQSAAPTKEEVAKAADAKTILVVGDFLGAGLADGLREAFADNANVRVVARTNGSSGFVRNDHYDWPAQIGPIIETEKPDIVAVMIGSNDRQEMHVGQEREQPLTEAWTREYKARLMTFAAVVTEQKLPLVWVGMPAFKPQRMSADMIAFNDMYRAAAEGAGGAYVDIWDGFVDESGAFVMTGPDMNGQPVRLRGSDGINLTSAGKRKVAFYAEKALEKFLGQTAPVAGTPVGALIPPEQFPNGLDINSSLPISLGDPDLDGGSELLGLQTQPKRDAKSPAERLAIDGIAPEPAPGRADDFSQGSKPSAPPVAQPAGATSALAP